MNGNLFMDQKFQKPLIGSVAGLLVGSYVVLSVLKFFALAPILRDPYWFLYLPAAFLEAAAAAGLFFFATARAPWMLSLFLSFSFFVFSQVGPELNSCHCLGSLAEISPRGRTVLSAILLSLSALGSFLVFQPSFRRNGPANPTTSEPRSTQAR